MTATETVKKLSVAIDLTEMQRLAMMMWLIDNKVVFIAEEDLIGLIGKAFDDAKKNMEAKTIQ